MKESIPGRSHIEGGVERKELLRSRVEEYYRFVDAKHFERMFDLFSGDIYYKRCEEEIRGMEAFRNFYLKERTLEGEYAVNDSIIEGNKVAVYGIFHGSDGKILEFSDHFTFNDSGKIYERRTYLAQGFESTK